MISLPMLSRDVTRWEITLTRERNFGVRSFGQNAGIANLLFSCNPTTALFRNGSRHNG